MKAQASHWPLTLLGSVSSLFNLFLPIAMSRHLNPSAVGEFKMFFLYLAAVPALSLGVGFTNGTYLWGADPAKGTEKCRAAFLLAFTAGLVAAMVVLLAGFALGFSSSLFLFAIACPPAVAATIFEARLVAAGRVRAAAGFSAGFEFIRLATLLGAVMLGFGATALFALHAIAHWVKLLAAGFGLGILSPGSAAFRAERPALLRYAVPVSVAAVFDLLVLNADRYVLSALLLASDFAIYSFGCLLVPPLFVFEQAVNQVLIPKLARTQAGARAAVQNFAEAVESLLVILLPATAGLIAIADPLVRLLFTDAYRDAAVFLANYALFYTLLGIPQDVLARARGDSGWILRTSVFFGILALAATGIAASTFGALGALRAFLLVQALRRLYGLYYFAREERAPLTRVFPVRSALVFALAAAAAGVIARQVALHFPRPAPAVLLGGAAFLPVYFGLIFLFRRRALARLLELRRRR